MSEQGNDSDEKTLPAKSSEEPLPVEEIKEDERVTVVESQELLQEKDPHDEEVQKISAADKVRMEIMKQYIEEKLLQDGQLKKKRSKQKKVIVEESSTEEEVEESEEESSEEERPVTPPRKRKKYTPKKLVPKPKSHKYGKIQPVEKLFFV